MQKRKYVIPVIILCILATVTGYIVSIAFRSFTINAASNNQATNPRQQSLIDYIDKLETENLEIEQMILSLRESIEKLQKTQSDGSLAISSLQATLDDLNFRAGLTEVLGPGIIITIDDNTAGAEHAQKTNPGAYYPGDYIVHDRYLLYLVRALSEHSEAIAINNIRLGDNYNIRCVGTVILVNSSRLAPPYEIKIIGDPDALEAALTSSGQYASLKAIHLPVKYTKSDEILLPAYTGSTSTPDITLVEEDDRS